MAADLETLKKYEIPGRVAAATGRGGLMKLVASSDAAMAEVYLHGAHVTHFQKHGEAPLLFMSERSWFAPGKPIRGGVPVCFPWFGNHEGEPSHGFARITEWQVVRTAAAPDGTVTLHFALPAAPGREAWNGLRVELVVTVGQTLTLELRASNDACEGPVEFENCLHTYFNVGDIGAIRLAGLHNGDYLDNAAGGNGAQKTQPETALPITQETNRIYLQTAGAVEIRDEKLRRVVRVEKQGSQSTVVWNPWTTQKLPDDYDPAEYRRMICVESGNVKAERIALPPGKSSSLRVTVSSQGL